MSRSVPTTGADVVDTFLKTQIVFTITGPMWRLRDLTAVAGVQEDRESDLLYRIEDALEGQGSFAEPANAAWDSGDAMVTHAGADIALTLIEDEIGVDTTAIRSFFNMMPHHARPGVSLDTSASEKPADEEAPPSSTVAAPPVPVIVPPTRDPSWQPPVPTRARKANPATTKEEREVVRLRRRLDSAQSKFEVEVAAWETERELLYQAIESSAHAAAERAIRATAAMLGADPADIEKVVAELHPTGDVRPLDGADARDFIARVSRDLDERDILMYLSKNGPSPDNVLRPALRSSTRRKFSAIAQRLVDRGLLRFDGSGKWHAELAARPDESDSEKVTP